MSNKRSDTPINAALLEMPTQLNTQLSISLVARLNKLTDSQEMARKEKLRGQLKCLEAKAQKAMPKGEKIKKLKLDMAELEKELRVSRISRRQVLEEILDAALPPL